jgi:hypothetical protein
METRPTVYVVQETMKRNHSGNWRRVHDLTPAAAYGDLEILIAGRQNIPLTPQPLIFEFRDKLRKFTDDDYLLLVGDPILIGIAIVVASDINAGKTQLLKWDRSTAQYIKIKCDFRKY